MASQAVPEHLENEFGLASGIKKSRPLAKFPESSNRQLCNTQKANWTCPVASGFGCHRTGACHELSYAFLRRPSAERLNGFSGDTHGDKESINPSQRAQGPFGTFLNLVFFRGSR